MEKDGELRQGLTDGKRQRCEEEKKEKEEGSVSENPSAFLQHSSRVAPCTEGHTSSLETQPPPHTTTQWQNYTHRRITHWPECLHNSRAVSWQPRGGRGVERTGLGGGGGEKDRMNT